MNAPKTVVDKTWTITEAKARLSEVLRLASEQPQYIGTKNTYVLLPKEEWLALKQPKKPLGNWLVEHLSGIGEFPLPDRKDPEREIPFQS